MASLPRRVIDLRIAARYSIEYRLAFAAWFWPMVDAPGLRGGRVNKKQLALRDGLQREVDALYAPAAQRRAPRP